MKEILIYADWAGLPQKKKIGMLRIQISKGQEIFSFEYEKSWLQSRYAQEIDPDLKLYSGPQYLENSKSNFGLFLDSSPDRWGRMLMDRREAFAARKEGHKQKKILESDYLLGVSDLTRMGALRFKLEEDGNYLADRSKFDVPPIANIRELEQATRKLENDDFFEDKDANKWLSMLIAPGSSLGGARPKSNVLDTDDTLWIAKFPSKNDRFDIGAWEYCVNQMAFELGLDVAIARIGKFSQNRHTYLTKRFDRIEKRRIHFASAMTLLGYKDGYDHREGGSYLEIIELLEKYGSNPNNDIRELWKRIVFSVAISNTDDHLRNHGFLLNPKGWKLSPAYDINPNIDGTGLNLNISEDDNSLDFDLCMNVADYYRHNEREAMEYIKKTKNVVSQWKIRAQKIGIAKDEIVYMERAFKI